MQAKYRFADYFLGYFLHCPVLQAGKNSLTVVGRSWGRLLRHKIRRIGHQNHK
ncbi:MAG: hypothetical protein OXT03_07035 [Alphaproteobacteria bacterium]|nr:hypothetical protein [Alphaproteobacteria bacterium]